MNQPINPVILEKNPRFKLLYQDLSNSRLNVDGSSRLIKQQRAQADIEKALYTSRIDHSKDQLIQEALLSIINQGKLPPDLLKSCQIVYAILNGDVSSTDSEILESDIQKFTSRLSEVTPLISAYFDQSISTLSSMMDLSESSQLLSQVTNLIHSINSQSSAIINTRNRILDLSEQIHINHREIIEGSIRILEQTIHGSVARGIKARAEHLSTVAKGLDYKIKILVKSDPILDNQDLQLQLKSYNEILITSLTELKKQVNETTIELSQYEQQGKGLDLIGKKYLDITIKCEKLNEEIAGMIKLSK